MTLSDVFNSISGSFLILKFLAVVVTIIGTVLIAKVTTIYLRRSFKEKISKDHLDIILKVIYYSIIIIAILFFVFPILGVEASSLLVAGGVVGLVIGFASQNIVGNLMSGFFLMVERPIKVGNQVNIGGNAGWVEDINIISTIIRTYDGLYVRIPNEMVFTDSIINYVAHVARRFEYMVGIRYSDDADEAIYIIKKLIESYPFALKSPGPLVFVDNLGDNSVNITVKIWAPTTNWYALKTEILWKIKKTLEENGIEIAFPQRVVWLANDQQKQEVTN